MNPMYIKLGVAAALMFAGYKGYGKKPVINAALMAVGVSSAVKNVPVVNQYVG